MTNFLTPAFSASAGAESALWSDSFTNAYGNSNRALIVAPAGTLVAGVAVAQTTPGSFIIGSPSGDIYSFLSTNTFVLARGRI